MAVSTRTRFEVFKRDGFTCQYCGRKSPEVVLHVDHIEPVAEGGSDEMFNLVTACKDCNLGKSAKPLKDAAPPFDAEKAALQVRAVREYREELEAYEEYIQDCVDEVRRHWRSFWEGSPNYTPWPNMVKGWLKQFSVAEIKEAIDIAYARVKGNDSEQIGAYLGGIIRNKKRDMEVEASERERESNLRASGLTDDEIKIVRLVHDCVYHSSVSETCAWPLYEEIVRPELKKLDDARRDFLRSHVLEAMDCMCPNCMGEAA